MSTVQCCRDACDSFDRIIEDRPHMSHERLSGAVQRIIELRDALIAERRSGEPGQTAGGLLTRVNSILSLAGSAEFPLVGVRWERIVAVRKALHALNEDVRSARRNGVTQQLGPVSR